MSKERARRREEREREAAIKQAARAAEAERRERQTARREAVKRAGRRVGIGRMTTGRPDGILARRRRNQHWLVLGLLLVLLVAGWTVRPDWPARLAFLVVAVLAYPVLRVLLFKRV